MKIRTGRQNFSGALLIWLAPAFANPVTSHANRLAIAAGQEVRGWLLGVLTCLCLGILGAAIVGGVIFWRARRKPGPKPAPAPVDSRIPAPVVSPPPVAAPAPKPAVLSEARLVILHGLVDPSPIELITQPVTIGRDATNLLVVNDSIASRRHAQIEPIDNEWVVRDLSSVNGTLVNGKSIARHILKDGDHIEIGTAVMEFQIVQPEE